MYFPIYVFYILLIYLHGESCANHTNYFILLNKLINEGI